MRRKAVWGGKVGRLARLVLALIVVALAASCGEMSRQGTASSYLIVSAFEAASGAEPNEFGGTLLSDVLTVVDDVPTFFNDIGRVTFRLALKDPGSSESQLNPTINNFITINRYHVKFLRSDGQNRQGTDVPYEFDGAFTLTVGAGEASTGFTIVRNVAKLEAPLAALARNLVIISTIAEVTFYGRDQTGREVSAVARIGIDFANFGDPN